VDVNLWAAQAFFAAYRSAVGSTSPVTEKAIPEWDRLDSRVQAGYIEGAKAILIFAESAGMRINPESREAPVVEKSREAPFLYG
jgi:hypothetical protein